MAHFGSANEESKLTCFSPLTTGRPGFIAVLGFDLFMSHPGWSRGGITIEGSTLFACQI